MPKQNRILVAPLNWGLGHATRCIPIIMALIDHGFEPLLASDGVALSLLQKEFPKLQTVELPSYKIKYSEKAQHFKLKMIWDSPKVLKAIAKEKKEVKGIVKQYEINGIISDNRLGIYHKKIPTVFITHQLNVLSGNTTWFSSKVHRGIIKKFDACWVPDQSGKPNLTGKLGHLKKSKLSIAYLGPLSRLQKKVLPKKYDLMVLLSGPEPQRSMLTEKLLKELKGYSGKILFVKGKVEDEQKLQLLNYENASLEVYNFMQTNDLEEALNYSEMVLCRSGYTTVMDLAKLEKKAFFIPTPGQYEQEYLAKRLDKKAIVPYASQKEFKLAHLENVKHYAGLKDFETTINYDQLFSVFSKVKENSEPTSTSLSK